MELMIRKENGLVNTNKRAHEGSQTLGKKRKNDIWLDDHGLWGRLISVQTPKGSLFNFVLPCVLVSLLRLSGFIGCIVKIMVLLTDS